MSIVSSGRAASTHQTITNAAEARDIRKALRLFASIIGAPTREGAYPIRYSETTGEPIEYELRPWEWWKGKLPECYLTEWLKQQMQEGETVILDGIVIQWVPARTEVQFESMSRNTYNERVASYFQIAKPRILQLGTN